MTSVITVNSWSAANSACFCVFETTGSLLPWLVKTKAKKD
jgi:hypothetical protein